MEFSKLKRLRKNSRPAQCVLNTLYSRGVSIECCYRVISSFSFKTFFMESRLFWRPIISRCCIWTKLNMVKMVALWGGRYQFTVKAINGSENVGADITLDVWMCDSVFISVVCLVKCLFESILRVDLILSVYFVWLCKVYECYNCMCIVMQLNDK